MKKIILTLCAVLCLTAVSFADPVNLGDVLDKFPMKQGVAYSIPDQEWRPMASFSVVKKWGLSLDAGYVGEDKLVGAVFYHLGRLENLAEIPILNFVDLEVGAYYGLEGINRGHAGEDYGASLKILEIKF